MRAVVLQSNYLPWKGYFDLIHDADIFVYYDEVQYTKNDWRNRNRILSKNGQEWLTVPIPARAVKLRISQVEMVDCRWQEKHYRSVYFAYKRAPHFGQLEPLLKEIYLERQWKRLSELNRFCIERIARLLGIRTAFLDSKELEHEGDRVGRLVGTLRKIGATDYISGPSAESYLEGHEHLFSQNGINLSYKSYANYPVYRQLSEPFTHEVSILDMIANVAWAEIPYHIWGWRKNANTV